jgi:hypothetical protein
MKSYNYYIRAFPCNYEQNIVEGNGDFALRLWHYVPQASLQISGAKNYICILVYCTLLE